MLKTQQQRHCFVKIDTEATQPLLKVPLVRRYAVAPATMLKYKERAYSKQGARSGAEVDRLIEESEKKFLTIGMPSDDADEIFAGAEVKIIEHKKPPAVKVHKRKKTNPKIMSESATKISRFYFKDTDAEILKHLIDYRFLQPSDFVRLLAETSFRSGGAFASSMSMATLRD